MADVMTIGLVQIAQVNWSHRKREHFRMDDGVIVQSPMPPAAPAPSFVYLPYGVGCLQAYAQAHAADPSKFCFLPPVYKHMPVADIVAQMAGADLVGFSSYVWNVNQNLAAARELKRRRPDRIIVMGGPEVPNHPEAFLRANPFVDVVVHGEAEAAFLDVLNAAPTRDWASVGSTSHIAKDGRCVTTPTRTRAKDLSHFPSPYLSGVFDEIVAKDPDQGWMAMWETNRGCPYSCTFCDWGSAVASKISKFDMDRLKAEMDWFARNRIRFLFICDANFGILPRDIEIAQYLVDTYERHGAFVNISIQNAKNQVTRTYEIQKILTRSRVATFGATIAMQGVDPKTLKAIKRDNISLEAFNELQRRFKQDGLDTYTDVIVGLPGETYDSFADGLNLIISNGQHNRMTSYNCSVLINAEMGDPAYQARYGIEKVPLQIVYQHDDLKISRTEEVHEYLETIIATKDMPRDDWRRVRVFAWLTELLHFNRLLQVPFILMAQHYGFSYRRLVEAFMDIDPERYPTLYETLRELETHAAAIQSGEPEFVPSEKFLGIWWPADQHALIGIVARKRHAAFYQEAEALLTSLAAQDPKGTQPIRDAVQLNKALLRLPECFEDAEVLTAYNVGEIFQGMMRGEEVPLSNGGYSYAVDRSSTVWMSVEAWATDVILQVYQRGNYIYPFMAVGRHGTRVAGPAGIELTR